MSKVEIKKPKYREHEIIANVAKRSKTSKGKFLSSYSDFEIDADLLLETSQGNEKLVKEVQEFIGSHQKEGSTISGFLAVRVFRISKDETLNGKSKWIHVVFDHGHGVTIIAGRVGHADWSHKQFMDKSLLYSMATMLENG